MELWRCSGAPLAHEDHAVRACYAALRMQESVAQYAADVRHAHGMNVQIRELTALLLDLPILFLHSRTFSIARSRSRPHQRTGRSRCRSPTPGSASPLRTRKRSSRSFAKLG